MKWKLILFLSAIIAVTLMLFLMPENVFAEGDDDGDEEVKEPIKQERIDEATKKALEWLKKAQKGDGSWMGGMDYELWYQYGTTALCIYALLKGGEPQDSKHVKKGFNYLKSRKFPGVYGTACLILALSAYIDAGQKKEDQPKITPGSLRTEPIKGDSAFGKKIKSPKWAKKWIKLAVKWLIKNKGPKVWRYPGAMVGEEGHKKQGIGGDEDASNTQYVMMAFFACRRLGINVKRELYQGVADYFIMNQEKTGPKVKPPFYIPGADLNLKDLKDIEKKWRKEFNKSLAAAKKAAKKAKKKFEGVDPRTVMRDDPYRNFEGEEHPMWARGWAYFPSNTRGRGGNIPDYMFKATGAMTASGVICCMLAKAELEGTSWYKKHGKKLRKSIYDGMAWLAHNWKLDMNPGVSKEDSWRYYHYYSIERAGVLALVHKIGKHDWYQEMAERILSEQSGDGSWPGASAAVTPGLRGFAHGPTWNTCFALLFLKRATTPIVPPESILTGHGIGGKGGKK